MLTLYGTRGSGSAAVEAALARTGQAFEPSTRHPGTLARGVTHCCA